MLLGCSTDTRDKHARWAASEDLPYPLLADPDGRWAEAFGVKRGLGPLKVAARTTFVIGPDGRIAHVFEGVTPREHAQEVLAKLRELGLAGDGA